MLTLTVTVSSITVSRLARLSVKTSARRADTLMPSSIRVVDGLAGVSAPAEHVAIGFTGWRCQASPATQDGSPTSRRRSFYLFLMPDAFPSMPLTDAQAAVKAGEAVLAYERWCRTTYTPESVCRTREVRGLR